MLLFLSRDQIATPVQGRVVERELSRDFPSQSRVVVIVMMAAGAEAPDSWYLALLGFAEHFRTSSPPKIRLCVHCLQAVFQFKPPQRVEARTHLQLGSVLYHHTKNSELARTHLDQAVRGYRKDRGFSERVGRRAGRE